MQEGEKRPLPRFLQVAGRKPWPRPHAPSVVLISKMLSYLSPSHRTIRGQHLHVISALEGCRLPDVNLAHASDHLFDRVVLVLFHPSHNFAKNLSDASNAIA